MKETGSDFQFYMPVDVFEKSDQDGNLTMTIGGICTTAAPDKEGETILQHGLDFTKALTNGWYNDDHQRGAHNVLGVPKVAKYYQKGAELPNGGICEKGGWWTEGDLLNTPKCREIYDVAKALKGTERSLGFSIEGKIIKRINGGKTIAKAEVRNIAITPQPVNDFTGMETLCKSMGAICKGLEVGSEINPPAEAVPGDGFALRTESLEGATKKKKKKKCLNKAEAVQLILECEPNLSLNTARQVAEYAFQKKEKVKP